MAQVSLQRAFQVLYDAGFTASISGAPASNGEHGRGITATLHNGRQDRREKVTFMRVLTDGRTGWPPEGDVARWLLEAALRVGIGPPDETIQQLLDEATS